MTHSPSGWTPFCLWLPLAASAAPLRLPFSSPQDAASFGHKEVDFTGVLVLGIDRENVLQAQLADARSVGGRQGGREQPRLTVQARRSCEASALGLMSVGL